jgi:hypothetical protein
MKELIFVFICLGIGVAIFYGLVNMEISSYGYNEISNNANKQEMCDLMKDGKITIWERRRFYTHTKRNRLKQEIIENCKD